MVSGALSVTGASPTAIPGQDMGQIYRPELAHVGAHHNTDLSQEHIDPTNADEYLPSWDLTATWNDWNLDEGE